ncbi:MAG: hypothetical protein KJ600_01095 [Nanoarchaeota archaeon]|nr:hypothetical protein [Nanoarchaeota archaeon]MBU1103138.1 hypothetical protein [Nanoarchaeota archaeon]
MKPRLAYIDHALRYVGCFLMRMRIEEGIEITAAESLEDFLKDHDLNDFSVLLYHPGRKKQYLIPEVKKRFPHLRVAGITAPGSQQDYLPSDEFPMFTYNAKHRIAEFVRGNQ